MKEQLQALKSKLHSHKMSVLVGSGFSKNVDKDKFLSWDELLKDMVLYLYEDDILKKKGDRIDFFEKKIKKIIEKEGYLEIVSQYIKRKGFREAIEVYIETHTPSITKTGTDLFIEGVFNENLYKDEISLSLHAKLLELPWNNIYTTNYDNLLESTVDDSIKNQLVEKIEKTKKELKEQYKQKEKLEEKLYKIEQELSNIESKLFLIAEEKKKLKSNPSIVSITNFNENELEEERRRNSDEKRKIDFDFSQLARNITNNESEKLTLDKELSQCITTILHSSDLQIKRDKNIIKLHGSLRKEGSDFGFDGDNHLHYIIAKEDYETYPTRHEAFTQLMRISLLQESYCLIGFSGIDPNFTSWISWVRDIIERKKSQEKTDYKIYIIEVFEENSTNIEQAEKELFFENHRIVKIPLWKKEIINFLEKETNIMDTIDEKNPKQLLKFFFQYISNEEYIYKPQAYIELSEQKLYNGKWQNITERKDSYIKLSSNDNYKEIERLKDKARIPSVDWINFHDKQTFLFYICALLKNSTSEEQKIILNLLPIAIRDVFLTPRFLWKKGFDDIMPYIKEEKHKTEISKIQLREAILFANKDVFDKELSLLQKAKIDEDILKYESILYAAFTFDFVLMKKQLDDWQPERTSPWMMIKKMGLLSLFDAEESKNQLNEYCNNFDNLSLQEQMYALETLNYIGRNKFIIQTKDEIQERIKQYKQSGFKSLLDNFDYIVDKINKEKNKNKIMPYGDGRFSVSNSFNLSNTPTQVQYSVQFIQLLIEFGIPLSLTHIHLKDSATWYSIANHIYEFIPSPTVYYSLQINDEKILRRIAQEYAYSEQLKDIIPDILKKLLAVYLKKETPILLKNNILIFVSELFIAVPPTQWQSSFYKIWELLENQNTLFYENLKQFQTRLFSFITKGLVYIDDENIIRSMILSILENYETDPDTAIEYLYYFADNNTKNNLGRKIVNRQMDEQINVLIEKITQENERVIFALGNLHSLLSQSHKEAIEKAIEKLDFKTIHNEQIWHVILFFAKRDSIRIAIKNGIIENAKLWHTGINGNSISSQHSFISLHLIDKKYSKNGGIEWNTSECEAIYNKLKENFTEIERVSTKNERDFINFRSILEEMNYFLANEKPKLKNISDYDVISEEVKRLYHQERRYETIKSALLSDDHSTIVWALSELFYDIYYISGIEKRIDEINLLVNKILMKKSPGLEECIIYLSNLLKNRKNDNTLTALSSILCLILDEYNEEYPNVEKPFLHQNMIQIAEVLEDWGIKHSGIEKWLEIKAISKFNNILCNA
ncbi:hypothetical protein EZS27_021644 [termite gut metagenome]|uniref:Uncharacterized protein n=1 Tax=termite gut metagenome TaxID=433724 RepID=A0A5J4R762_9ZZZZ